MAAVVLSVAIGLFELTQDLVRARLLAVTVMKATLVRAVGRPWPGRGCRAVQPDGIPAAAFVGAGLSARRPGPVANRLAGNDRQIRRCRSFGGGEAGPAADTVADIARHLQRHRSIHDRQPRRCRGCRKVCRGARPGSADPDDTGDERRRGVLSARRANSCQPRAGRGAIASRRMRGAAAQHYAAGLPGLRRHFIARRQCRSRRRFSRGGRDRPCRSWRSP